MAVADTSHEPLEWLQEAVDGRLSPAQMGELNAHLATCQRCRRELDALQWTRAQAVASRLSVPVPGELEVSLGRVLNEADAQPDSHPLIGVHPVTTPPARAEWFGRRAVYAALAAAVLLGLWILPGVFADTPSRAGRLRLSCLSSWGAGACCAEQ